jgi:hypothetical protein
MKNFARDLNVSVITVSKLPRNYPDISEATRDRVLRRMQELNYRPNLAARAPVTGKSFSIGLIVLDPVHPFLCRIDDGHLAFSARTRIRTGHFIIRRKCLTRAAGDRPDAYARRRRDDCRLDESQESFPEFLRTEEERGPRHSDSPASQNGI